MTVSISDRIYEAFFDRLSRTKGVSPETIAALRSLHRSGRLGDKARVRRLTQEMEARHAQDQDAQE